MLKVGKPGPAAPATEDLKGRILSFMRGASTEITPSEENRLPELKSVLPAGTTIYVAHTPKTTFAQVIQAALAVRRAGLLAAPHIAVRRVADLRTLRSGLAQLRAGGVEQILLIAGDAPTPLGELSGTLDVLESHVLEESGITRIGVAGHPEGHNAVDTESLWNALIAKQAYALREGVRLHIVTQFGFEGGALAAWQRELAERQILLPVRVGIAGPASAATLLHFALQCGIGASTRVLMGNFAAAARKLNLVMTPDQHLLALSAAPPSEQIIAPHFFAFGGALQTARWMAKVAAGAFDIDEKAARFKLHAS